MCSSNQLFIQDAVMLIIKPIAVDNIGISNHFIDWNPEAIKLAIVFKYIMVNMYQ